MRTKLIISVFLAAVCGCSSIGRESAITAEQTYMRACDVQVGNLDNISTALAFAVAGNRIKLGHDPTVVITDLRKVLGDIKEQAVNHADANRALDYCDIYLQSQRWWGEVLFRHYEEARAAATTQPAK